MGVDYSAEFGIGFKVVPDQEIVEKSYQGDYEEWLEDLLEGTEFLYFRAGDTYSEDYTFFITISLPKGDKVNWKGIQKSYESLEKFLIEHEVTYKVNLNNPVIGDLHVW